MKTTKRLGWKVCPWVIAQEYAEGGQKEGRSHERRYTIQFWGRIDFGVLGGHSS